MKPGLYDHLLTKAIEAEIARLGDPRLVALAPLDSEDSHSVLAQYLERLIASSLALHRGSDAAEKQRHLVERIVGTLTEVLSDQESDGFKEGPSGFIVGNAPVVGCSVTPDGNEPAVKRCRTQVPLPLTLI